MSRAAPNICSHLAASVLSCVELIVVETQTSQRAPAATSSSAVPPSAGGSDRDLLDTGCSLEHRAVPIHAEAVGNHTAGYDNFAESPTRLDDSLVSLVDRVLREQHPGDVGIEKRLDDDTDARACEEAHALAVGDRRVGVRRPPDLLDRITQVVDRRNVEQRQVLAGKARICSVLVDRRRAHCERPHERTGCGRRAAQGDRCSSRRPQLVDERA